MHSNQTSTSRLKRIASLVAVGVAIPAFAFFVGSQSGGGELSVAQAAKQSSSSGSTSANHGGPRGPLGNADFVEDLSEQLGVTTEQLEAALKTAKPAKPNRPSRKAMRKKQRQELAALAKEMGVTTTELKAALKAARNATDDDDGDRPRGGPGGRGGPGHHGGPGGPGAIGGPGGGPGGPSDEFIEVVAEKLGISSEKVEDAFDARQAAHEAEHEARHNEFAQKLATALNLDVAKVKEALEALRPEKPSGN